MLVNMTPSPAALPAVLPVELLGDLADAEVEFWTAGRSAVLHLGARNGTCATGAASGVVVAVGSAGEDPTPELCGCAVELLTHPELHDPGTLIRRLAQVGQIAAVSAEAGSAAAALAAETEADGPSADLVRRAGAAVAATEQATAALTEISHGSPERLAGLIANAELVSACVDRLVRPGSGLAESVTTAAVLAYPAEMRPLGVSEALMGVNIDGTRRTRLTWAQNVAASAWCEAVASGLSWRQAQAAVATHDTPSAGSGFSREFYDRVAAAASETLSGPLDVVVASVPFVSPFLAFAEVWVPSSATRTWDAAFVCPPSVTDLIVAGSSSPLAARTGGPWHLRVPLVVAALGPGEGLSDDDRAALATLLLSEPPALASAGTTASVAELEESVADLFAGLAAGLVDRAAWRAGRREVEEAARGSGSFEATLLVKDFTPARFRAARAAAAVAANRLGFTVDPDEEVLDERSGEVIGSLRDPMVVVRLLVLDAADDLVRFGVNPGDVSVAES